jgi:hypothetical protein
VSVLKHVEDQADLSLFISDDGEIGFVCANGHQWTLDDVRAQRIAEQAGTDALRADRPLNVIDVARQNFPSAFKE